MNSRPDPTLRTIFSEAMGIGDTESRATFLARACGGDADLRREVEELLEAEARAGGFLPKEPAAASSRAALRGLAEALGPGLPSAGSARSIERVGDWIGRYKLLEQIGEGGCGVVYMAEQEESVRRKVALKVIKLGMDSRQVIARFEAERQALAMMDHPNIAKVLDAGATETGRPYFVMELVRGIKMTDYCDQNRLGTRTRLELFIQVCQAAQHAHAKGIIHRDLKPSNILVTVSDGKPLPKVIDFGIAKATEGRLTDQTFFTGFQQFLGTPAYMSPEQAAMCDAEIDSRSDIYSLGVLLYELLTGKTPFATETLLSSGLDGLRRTIREKEPERPSMRLQGMGPEDLTTTARSRGIPAPKLIHQVRGDLDSIVVKCLEKESGRRYQTAKGLEEDLSRYLKGEPIVARPVGAAGKFTRWCRRKPVVAGLGGAIALLVLTIMIGSPIAVYRMNRSRAEAVQAGLVTQHNLVRQYVANGTRLMNDGDLFASLLWYTEALRLDAGDPKREEPHRIRISSVLRQCPKLINVFTHGNLLYHAVFSPDDQTIATCSDDHTARLWDVETGAERFRLRHDDEVYHAYFSPEGDRLVTASADGTARIWDTRTGVIVTPPLRHAGAVWVARFSPDGKVVATASSDSTARVWNAATGTPIGNPLLHPGEVLSVMFSPNGNLLATADSADNARIWDLARGDQVFPRADQTNLPAVAPLKFSSDGKRFLCLDGKHIRIWDTGSMIECAVPPLDCGGNTYDASFSPNGRFVVGTSWVNNTTCVWDSETGKLIFPSGIQQSDYVLSMAISPDSRKLVLGNENRDAQVWSARTGRPLCPPLKHIMMVKGVSFSSSGRWLLVNSCDQAARVWDLATSDDALRLPLLPPGGMRLSSPDGSHVLTADSPKVVRLENRRSGQSRAVLPHRHPVRYASFSPDGRTILTGCQRDNYASSQPTDLYLWEGQTGQCLNEQPMQVAFFLHAAAFSPDGKLVATGGLDFMARVWNARTGRPVTPLMRHDHRVNWVGFRPDGKVLATASWDKSVRVWDAKTGEPFTAPLRHNAIVFRAYWSDDKFRLFTITEKNQVQIWDLENGEPMTPPLEIKVQQGAGLAGNPENSEGAVLSADDRPVADLVALAQMFAVGRIDLSGNQVPLNRRELTNAWAALHEKYPRQFAVSTSEIANWHRREAAECESEEDWAAARFHLDRALRIIPTDSIVRQQRDQLDGSGTNSTEHQLRQVGTRHRLPQRDARAGPEQIDLSGHYNLTLTDSLLFRDDANTFFELQPGLINFNGLDFDLRGLVHISGQALRREGVDLPERIDEIPVGRKCRRLHFIHAASWDSPAGTQVGAYVLHYADGQLKELPIIFGRDLANYWFWSSPFVDPVPGAAATFWTGSGPIPRVVGADLRLFESTRVNPLPDVEVVSLDFVSAMTEASPFLAALTVD